MSCIAFATLSGRATSLSAQELSVVGTPQQANDRIRTLSESAKSAPREYTIGNGDLLSISVFDVPELSREVRVSQSGTISIPLVPARLHIAGLTEIQAEQKIADVLEADGLVSHPEVNITVKEHKSRPITIVGAVQHPLVYEADSSVTLLEALAAAGGVSNDAGDVIIVTRPHAATFIPVPNPGPIAESAPGTASAASGAGQVSPLGDEKSGAANQNPPDFPSVADLTKAPVPTGNAGSQDGTNGASGNLITINLNELLETGDTRNNIPLQAGDVVTVPHAGIVYVLGAVNRPGGFVLSNDRTQMTTLKILALAGGVGRTAKLDHAIIIRKDEQGKQTETGVDLKKVIDRQAEDVNMRPSDILYIPNNAGKQALYQALQIALAVGTAVAIYRISYH